MNLLFFEVFEVLLSRKFSFGKVFMISFFFFKSYRPFLEIFDEDCRSKIDLTWLRDWVVLLNFSLDACRNLIFFLRMLIIFLLKFLVFFWLIIVRNLSCLRIYSIISFFEWAMIIRNLMIMISITIPWTLLMFVVSPFRLLIASMIILKSWNIIILRSASTSPSLVSLRLIVSVKIMNLLLVIVRMIVVTIGVIVIMISVAIVVAIIIILIIVIIIVIFIIIVLFIFISLPHFSFTIFFSFTFFYRSFFFIRMLFIVNKRFFWTIFVSFFCFSIAYISFSIVFFLLFSVWNLFDGTQLSKLELVRVFIHQPTFLTVMFTFLLRMSFLKIWLVLSTFLLQSLIKSIFFEFSHFFDFAFQCHIGFLKILDVLVIHFIHIDWFQQLGVVRDTLAALIIVIILVFNLLETDLAVFNI